MVRLFPKPRTRRQVRRYYLLLAILIVVPLEAATLITGAFFLLHITPLNPNFLSSIAQLVEWPLPFALLVSEVPIGTFLWFLLGERTRSQRQQISDAMDKYHGIKEMNHLKIHYVKGERGHYKRFAPPFLVYYLSNDHTGKATYCPEFIQQLAVDGVIESIQYDSEKHLLTSFKEKSIQPEKRQPNPSELL